MSENSQDIVSTRQPPLLPTSPTTTAGEAVTNVSPEPSTSVVSGAAIASAGAADILILTSTLTTPFPVIFTPGACGLSLPISACTVQINNIELVGASLVTSVGTDGSSTTIENGNYTAIFSEAAWPTAGVTCMESPTLPASAEMASSCFTSSTATIVWPGGGQQMPIITQSSLPTGNRSTATPSSSVSGIALTSKSRNGSLGTGAAVGIAVGCFVAGALFATLFACMVLRRKLKRSNTAYSQPRNHGYRAMPEAMSTAELKEPPTTVSALALATSASIIDTNLPDEAPDSLIQAGFSSLEDLIRIHVQTFLTHNSSADHLALARAVTAEVGNRLPLTQNQIYALLASPSNRPTVLRFIIAWIIVSRIGLESPPELSLLPPGVAQSIQTMPDIRSNDKGRLIHN
jgi:hypothetical protein